MLEAAMQHVAEGVVIVDGEGHFLLFNEAAHKILGLGPVDVPPAEWSRVYGCYLPDKATPYPGEDLPLVRATRGERILEDEIFIRNPGNPEGSWISVDSSPLVNEQGEPVGGVIVFRDVTGYRSSREVLEQLSRGIERTTDAVFVTDANGFIEYVNPAFETITGYARDEVLGQKPSLLKSGRHGPGYYEALWTRILSGQVHTGTLVNRKKDGALFLAEQTITPIKDARGRPTHFVSVMRDVTELQKAREIEVEMRLARRVQQKLYPTHAPRFEGFDLAGATFPADHTCGDYYDFIPMADGRVGIAVGDVSGHGFPAALLMAETRAYLRSLSTTTTRLDEILGRLNAFLCQDTEDERYVTLMLVVLDPARRSIVYASAGHPPGYLLDQTGRTRRILESTSMPLGISSEAGFVTSPEMALATGDLLLLLTDGAAEAQNDGGDFFEAQRVLTVVAGARACSASEIVRDLHRAVSEFAPGSPQRDDVTAVVCKVGPSPAHP
jgi:sigma-B regulation protein RsbU (phosphoserine phosphatase)